jgi:hypothetical protein
MNALNKFVMVDTTAYESEQGAALFLSGKTGERVTARQVQLAIEFGLAIGGHKVRYVKAKPKSVVPDSKGALLSYPDGGRPIERGIGDKPV